MNNKICREYISEVKTLFPVMGNSERKYIKKLTANVENCCQENEVNTKQDLYESYGLPNDVVHDYYSSVDTDYIIKKIRISKYIKLAVAVVLTVGVIVTSTFCVVLYKGRQAQQSAQNQISKIENIIQSVE